MPEYNLRFAARTADGRSSDIWKVWTSSGTGRRDVYMTSRPLGHALKLSLHAGGQWHVGFDAAKKDVLFAPGELPATRFLGKWDRADTKDHPIVLAARVYFPWSSPSLAERDAPLDICWIDSAPEGLSVEVVIFLASLDGPPNDWPGKTNMGTSLLGSLPLEGGGQVYVVCRRNAPTPNVPSMTGAANFFRDGSREDLETANRIVVWVEEQDGSISFIESRLEVIRPSPA